MSATFNTSSWTTMTNNLNMTTRNYGGTLTTREFNRRTQAYRRKLTKAFLGLDQKGFLEFEVMDIYGNHPAMMEARIRVRYRRELKTLSMHFTLLGGKYLPKTERIRDEFMEALRNG